MNLNKSQKKLLQFSQIYGGKPTVEVFNQQAVSAKIASEQQKRLQTFVDLHRDEIDGFDVVHDSMSVHFKDEVPSSRVEALMGELLEITGTIQLPGRKDKPFFNQKGTVSII